MPAYYKNTVHGFLKENQKIINSDLTSSYTNDGYYQLLGTQSKSWEDSLPIIYEVLAEVYQYDSRQGSGVCFLNTRCTVFENVLILCLFLKIGFI